MVRALARRPGGVDRVSARCEHVVAEEVELGLGEPRRQPRRRLVLAVLERLRHGWHVQVRRHGAQHHLPGGGPVAREFARHRGARQHGGAEVVRDARPVVLAVVLAAVAVGGVLAVVRRPPERPLQHVDHPVRLDDAPPAPQLQQADVIQTPALRAVLAPDNVEALREARQEAEVRRVV